MATPAELLDPARRALSDGDLETASKLIDEVESIHPDSPEPLKARAEVARARGDFADVLAISYAGGERFPTHQWWKQLRGEALDALDRAAEAQAFYQTLLVEEPTSLAALKALMKGAFTEERWEEAAAYAATGRAHYPDHKWWRQTGGWALERSGRSDDARSWYGDILSSDPVDVSAHAGLLHLDGAAHRWPSVFARCRTMLNTLTPVPDSAFGYLVLLALTTDLIDDARQELKSHLGRPEVAERCLGTLLTIENHFGQHERAIALTEAHPHLSSSEIDLARAYALMGSVRYDEAESAFAAVRGEAAAEAGVARALMLNNQLRLDAAVDVILQTHKSYPDDEMVWRTAFYLLQEASRFDDAQAWLDRRRNETGDSPRLRLEEAGLYRSRMDFDRANEILDQLLTDTSVDGKTRRAALLVRADTARRSQAEPERMAQIRQLLVDDKGRDRNGDYVLIRTHIALGELDEAAAMIEALSSELDSWDANVFRAWLAARRGDITTAKAHGERFLARRFYTQLHSEITQLEQRTEAPSSPGDIVAFVACRDEERRLPDFLRHHRTLGVDRFVIVDNKSSDRTSEYLANQEDVSLFYTEDDYVQSGLGMRWINELIGRLAEPHWCLFADVDELLIYPDCETRSIHEFTADLDRLHYEGAGGYMLDMHGETLNATINFRAGNSMLDTSPYFTNAYDFQDFHLGPYVDVRGGFRSETLGIRNLQMTKTPLIRSDSGIKFLSSSHETTPGAIAKVATVFLHFKYIGDALARAEKEADWTPYMYYGNNTTKLRQLSSGDDFSLMTENTHRYESSRQLAELGLLWNTRGSLQ